MLKGGESGEAALVPGKRDDSPLVKAMQWDGLEMPPKENDRLNAAQIELVKEWVEAGAPWPSETEQQSYREAERAIELNDDGMLMKTSGGLSDEWTYRRYKPEDIWAFRPVKGLTIDEQRLLIAEGKKNRPPGDFNNQQSAIGNHQSAAFGQQSDPYLLPEPIQARRLALAKWIAHPQNPLTTRAIVNRVWQHHFGKALAGNPNNFGVKGAKPTHPVLLDFLTADFVEHGWRLKRLHKVIMLSQAYRMCSQHPQHDSLRESDPNNDLLAYFPTRRLSAEEMRDAMLSVTGELNREQGGLPVMPEINLEVALQPRMIQFSLAPSYQPSLTPQERNRRSIYAYRVRGQADPFLEVFNQPNSNDSCEDRDCSAVSPQSFTLFNSDLMTDRSIALALRVEKEAQTTDQQLSRAFELTLGRLPSIPENDRLRKYLKEMRDYHAQLKPEPVTYPTKVTRSLVKEFSGKTFEYDEILPTFENYTPDKKAADVSAESWALADVCLLLFNSHAFVYLD